MKTSTLVASLRCGFALALISLTTTPARAETPPASPTTRTWTLQIAGEMVGSFNETTAPATAGGTQTREEMRLTINRLGSKVVMHTLSETEESPAGDLVALSSSSAMGAEPVKVRVQRDGTTLRISTEAGGKNYDKTLTTTERLLGPRGVSLLSREQLRAPGDRLSYHQFLPEVGAVAALQRTVVSREERGVWVEEEVTGVPGKARLLLDTAGRWMRRELALPFGQMVFSPATVEAAAKAEAGGTLPGESYDRTMARSNVRLPDPRSLSAVTVRLRHRAPDLGWPDFAHGGQRVLTSERDALTIAVRRLPQGQAAPAPGEEYRRPNALVQSDDAEVVRLAREITAGVRGDLARARKLQDWVNLHMELDLGVAVASASEIARNRRGTCIASAVLLAALQRAIGLPSRVAMGFVYYGGIWGGHAWTEVYLDGRWLGLDAAMYAPGAADAARLCFGTSSGEDRLAALVSGGSKMYANVDIAVTSYELQGRVVEVPAGAAPQLVQDRRYENRWLRFAVTAPAGYRIGGLDAVFPDATIAAIENGQGTRVRIGQSIAGADPQEAVRRVLAKAGPQAQRGALDLGGRPAQAAWQKDQARLVLIRGTEQWTLSADGPEAESALRATAANWKWQ